MAATGSDYLFTEINDFILNQLLGYQDVNEQKDGINRLEAAFASQHLWDRDSDDATWAGNHSVDPSAGPTRDMGNHGGDIGIADGDDQTVYYGDGRNLHATTSLAYGSYTGDGTSDGSKIIATGFETATYLVVISGKITTPAYASGSAGWFWFKGCTLIPCVIGGRVTGLDTLAGDVALLTAGVTNITSNGVNFSVGVSWGPNVNVQAYTWFAIGI